jgi:flavin-dependent dehydrogenase
VRRTAPLIVGGGPAGAAAAIALAAGGVRPLLLERTVETGDALCGGFLSWRSLAALERLGIPADALNRDRIGEVHLFAGEYRSSASLPQPGLTVSRHTLDTLLLSRASAVAAVERGVAVRAIEHGAPRLADGTTLAADALFLATGKHDLRGVARPQTARGVDPTLGLRVRLPPSAALARLVGQRIELHLFRRGYAGIARQEDGAVNLCMAVHRSRLDEAGSPAALLATLGREEPILGERLAFMTSEPIQAVANVPYGWRARNSDPGLFRLGDQAAVIPSLAGEGMGIALASGVSAAHAFLRGGSDAATGWQARFAATASRPLAIAGLLRRLAEGPAAPWMVRAAFPGLIQLVADATRIEHIDA